MLPGLRRRAEHHAPVKPARQLILGIVLRPSQGYANRRLVIVEEWSGLIAEIDCS
jgi:hypothetical protein